MSAPKPAPGKLIPAHPRLAALVAFVLIYCPLLGMTFSSTGFSAAADAQRFVEQTMHRPPQPLPPLPVLKTFEIRDLVLQRDPLRALASRPQQAASAAVSERSGPFHFLTRYSDDGRTCVVSRDGADRFARFCSGDKIQDGTIARIESGSVIIEADDGKRHVVEIDAGPLGR